jgi:hypothetical protein
MSAPHETRRPPRAPWGAFPLSELTVLLAMAAALYGLLAWGSRSAVWALSAAACLGSLAGLEVAIREHLAAVALLWRAFERRRASGSASPPALSSPRRSRTAPSRPAGRG